MSNSRFPGFNKLSLAERRATLGAERHLDANMLADLEDGGLEQATADAMVENCLGLYALPFGVALNLTINGRDRLAPMVVEEPSVIAAASNAAKMIRAGGGFSASLDEPLMTTQIELREVRDEASARAAISSHKSALLELANRALPGLVGRGGGARELEIRSIGPSHLVVHLLVDCLDAMGANLVNTAAEAVGPELARLAQADLGLCILSNLCDRRVVRVSASVPVDELVGALPDTTGPRVAAAIAAASLFAERDPYRAVTHNKGIMNGVDAVVLATGNDFRAVEAGAHAYAARAGTYAPLATWRLDGQRLSGSLEMPLGLGTVGGTLRVHRGARLALALADIQSATDLAQLAAAVGLASNLAALRALSTEGISRGHMGLHARSVARAAGASAAELELVAGRLRQTGTVTLAAAEAALAELRQSEPTPKTP